ncbi:hypothetical protein BC831DRAFT_441024, partial [Entophlyctis helioformis]
MEKMTEMASVAVVVADAVAVALGVQAGLLVGLQVGVPVRAVSEGGRPCWLRSCRVAAVGVCVGRGCGMAARMPVLMC